jgi:hypothetical protein
MVFAARTSVLRAARAQFAPARAAFTLNQSALARLLSTLAVLEQRDGKLQSSSISAISAALKLGGPVTAFVAGNGVKATSAAEAAQYKGVEKVVAVESEAYEKVSTVLRYTSDEKNREQVLMLPRVFPKTMLPSSSRTSRRANTHTLSEATLPLERVYSPASRPFSTSNKSPISLLLKAKIVCPLLFRSLLPHKQHEP